MTFLEGAFLAGIAAVGIPVVLHLLHRRKAPPVRFPSLRFLKEVEVRTARRSRITEWLILLLRAAALLLLALALARPVLESGALGRGRASRVWVVDNSMSSGVIVDSRPALEQYRLVVKRLLERMEPADRGAIVPLHGAAGYAPALTENRRELERLVDTIVPTYRSTPLVDALRQAVGLLEEDENPIREIYALTDLQASAFASHVEALEIPERVRLIILRPRGLDGLNASFEGVEVRRTGASRPLVEARLAGHGSGEAVVRVTLLVESKEVEERAARAAAGGEVAVRFGAPELPAGLHRAELRIRDDLLAADNSLHFAFPAREPVRVLLVRDRERAAGSRDPIFYLARALVPRRSGEAPLRVQATVTESLGNLDLSEFHVVFLIETTRLDATAGRALAAFVSAGGGLFIAAGPGQEEDLFRDLRSEAGPLLPVEPGTVRRAEDHPHHLRDWDREHPIWTPLLATAPPLRPDVPLFFAYRSVRPIEAARVLAAFDSGDAALVERGAGMGKVLYFASTLSGAWNNLPLRFLFAPLAHSLAHHLAASPYREEEHLIGTPLRLAYPRELGLVRARVESTDGTVRELRSDGSERSAVGGGATGPGDAEVLTLELETPERPDLLVVTETYRERDGDGDRGGERHRLVAVRPEPRESDLTPLSPARRESLLPGAQLIEFSGEDEALRGAVLLTVGSELKNPLLFGLLALLLIEPVLANFTAARRRRAESARPGGVP